VVTPTAFPDVPVAEDGDGDADADAVQDVHDDHLPNGEHDGSMTTQNSRSHKAKPRRKRNKNVRQNETDAKELKDRD